MLKNFRLIKELLDEKYHLYHSRSFIPDDPISVPHRFTEKQDIEIAAFLAASIAWGNRKSILKSADKLIQFMDHSPYSFILGATEKDLRPFKSFVHRTFNGDDCLFFLRALKRLYKKYGSLEPVFGEGIKDKNENCMGAIVHFRKEFLRASHLPRSEKHLSDPGKNSSSKRLCMFLRWMVRKDKTGVDFGLWSTIHPSQLCLPLDVHTGNTSRNLGLLGRKQNDWKAVEEITSVLKQFDPMDPVKYDFALFGIGVTKSQTL